MHLLLGDPSTLFRQGCRRLLENEPGFKVIGEVATGHDAVRATRKLRPDIVLLEIDLPNLDGISATEIIMKTQTAQVMMVTLYTQTTYVAQAVQAGARAYLHKSSSAEVLVQSVRRVAQGGYLLTPGKVTILISQLEALHTALPAEQTNNLTLIEQAVLTLVATGATNKAIATELNVSEKTVRNYLWRLFDRLGFQNRTEAAVYALRSGLATLEER